MGSLYILIAKPPPSCLYPLRLPRTVGFHLWWLSTQSIRCRLHILRGTCVAFCFIGAICSFCQLPEGPLSPLGNLTITTVNVRGLRFGQVHTRGEAVITHWHPHADCRPSPIVKQNVVVTSSIAQRPLHRSGWLSHQWLSYFSRTMPGLPRVAVVNQQELPVVDCHA